MNSAAADISALVISFALLRRHLQRRLEARGCLPSSMGGLNLADGLILGSQLVGLGAWWLMFLHHDRVGALIGIRGSLVQDLSYAIAVPLLVFEVIVFRKHLRRRLEARGHLPSSMGGPDPTGGLIFGSLIVGLGAWWLMRTQHLWIGNLIGISASDVRDLSYAVGIGVLGIGNLLAALRFGWLLMASTPSNPARSSE